MSLYFFIFAGLSRARGGVLFHEKQKLPTVYFDLLSLSFYMLIFVKLGVGGRGGLILGYGMGLD